MHCSRCGRKGSRSGFLISPSVDGTAPAMLVEKIGGHVIRGSSTHTGARALRDYYETIVKQQVSPAITPDGPRGPVHEFKPGAVMLSQITGKPILPVAVAASRTFTFNTWDKFELPLPFSRVAIVYGEPVKIARTSDAECIGRVAATDGRALTRVARRSRSSPATRLIPPAWRDPPPAPRSARLDFDATWQTAPGHARPAAGTNCTPFSSAVARFVANRTARA